MGHPAVLKLSKMYPFCNFYVDFSKKSKAFIAVYVYASESSSFALLENRIGYYAVT